MTHESSSKIESLLQKTNSEILNWQNIPNHWQEKITKAINSEITPNYLIYPPTIQALAETVKIASENKLSILPCGNATKLNWGGLTNKINLVISTSKLNQIIEHAVGDLTITVEAGITLSNLQKTLNEKGQFLPIDPTYSESATIGGIVATADTGSWRQRYGGIRDMILGISIVRCDGQIAKAGGRVVKNVAGYDLMKLFTGSYGTLGIISEVTFRAYPLLESSQTLLLTGESNSIKQAIDVLFPSSLTPTAWDLLSNSLVNFLQLGKGIGFIIRFQSISPSVNEQITKIKEIAQELKLNCDSYTLENETNLWQKIQKTISIPVSNSAITCKIGVLPSAAVSFLNALENNPEKELGIIHLKTGLGRLYLDTKNPLNRLQKIRKLAEENQGFLTVLESPKEIKTKIEPWGYQGDALDIMSKIKKQFDPQNILNPHRFVGEI